MNQIPFFKHESKVTQASPGIQGVDYIDAVGALGDAGFWTLSEGEHVVMTDGRRILTIPRNSPVNALTMDGIVRDAGLSAEKFRKLL
jgi:hypothetical protein